MHSGACGGELMSQNAMPACLCSVQAQPEFLSIMQLKLGVGKRIPNSVQIDRQTKQQHYQTISKHPLCTSCIRHKCQMATSNKNRRLLVDSDDLFKYGATTPHMFSVPKKVTWLVAPLQLTFVKIGFAQISHVPESSHFQESRYTYSLQLLLLLLWHIHSELPQRWQDINPLIDIWCIFNNDPNAP